MKNLTPREIEVLFWIAQGKTCSEIAAILGVRYDTARSHTDRVKTKLDAANIAHAVALGYELGILGKKGA